MTYIQGIIQAVIQGLTEFLPVSSSGHLSLVQHFFKINGESAVLFSVILHMATLLAVFIAFRKTIIELIRELWFLIKDIFTGKFTFKKSQMSVNRWYLFMFILSMIPLLFFYFLSDFYTGIASDNDIFAEGVFFIMTGFLLYFADKSVKGKKDRSTIKPADAILIGIAQGIAPLPGISRSGITIATGIFCGLQVKTAIAFSFIMGIPPILMGSILELKDISESTMDVSIGVIVVSFFVALIVGLLAIKMVQWLAKTNNFRIFSYYTFILGSLTITAAILELIF